MSPRFPLLVAGSLSLVVLAACSGVSAQPGIGEVTPPATPPVTQVETPDPTPVPVPPTTRPEPTATPVIGGVDGDTSGPELVVVPVDDTTIAVSIEDPVAKGWRFEIRGTGDRAKDAWQITAETGDVGPLINAVEIVDGNVVDEMDLSGFWDGTAAAGGCHSTLPVCLDSNGFRLPDEGDGTFSVRLHLEDATVPLQVVGAAAYWEGEPFTLGPWHETQAFPWEPAAG
jgi:hypothetical protein